MKTAISVRDGLFKEVDKFAKAKKMSRSQVFSNAAEEYLRKYDTEDLVANLNQVYSEEDSSIDPTMLKMALLSVQREEW